MSAPYMGGLEITQLRWLDSHSLQVVFSSTYSDTYYYQLYAGRIKISLASPFQRQFVAALKPSDYPVPITVLAVTAANRYGNYGDDLPIRPYNRVRVTVDTTGWPADTKVLALRAGTTPGGAVDTDNVVAREMFAGVADYELLSPPMGPAGSWNFDVVGIDNRLSNGNVGTPAAFSETLLCHPQDVVMLNNGDRFTIAIANQQATVTFTLPA